MDRRTVQSKLVGDICSLDGEVIGERACADLTLVVDYGEVLDRVDYQYHYRLAK
jgi:hypothetical protein